MSIDQFPPDSSDDALTAETLATILAATEPVAVAVDTQAFLGQLRSRMMVEQEQAPISRRVHRRPAGRVRRVWVGVAMVAATVAATVLVVLGVFGPTTFQPSRSAERAQQYTTTAAQQSTVTFADGSRMTLAPRSQADVTIDPKTNARTVALRGQAYFEVTPSSRAPFVVRTGVVTTRVLGTAFDVRHYSDTEPVRVVVVSGKVSSGGSRSAVTLTAGSVGRVTDSTAVRRVVQDPHTYANWTSGRLEFDDTPVAEVLTTLEQWYGYRFRVSDPGLAKRRVTATFRVNEQAKTMAALRDLLDVTMALDDSVVTLTPRRAQRAPAKSSTPGLFTLPSEVGK